MTVAVCMNCGEIKGGAFLACPVCKSEMLDYDVSLLLTDHNLTKNELQQIGKAIKVVHSTALDEETRVHLLGFYLSRKWPKLLEYDIDAIEHGLSIGEIPFEQIELGRIPVHVDGGIFAG